MEKDNHIDIINSDLFELFTNLLDDEEERELLKAILANVEAPAVYQFFINKFRAELNDKT